MRIASLFFLAIFALAANASARDQIRAVGSSTVFPFVSAASEQFGKKGGFKTPIVESTGTGGGFKLFCSGVGDDTPDISNASRAIKPSEIATCSKNGVSDILEIKIGYDGIALANSAKAPAFDLTKKSLFLALARKVPQNGKLVDNPYQTWNEVDPKLPKTPITVYGPPPTSGTRDAFVEMVMVKVCQNLKEFEDAYKDEKEREKQCQLIREDGKFVEAGENDNLIVQKLTSNPDALGVFGFSYLEENAAKIRGNTIDGVAPTFENISSEKYGIARPLFAYFKLAHMDKVKGLKEFAKELVSDQALGDEGYMADKGLIPLHKDEMAKSKTRAEKLEKMSY